MPASDMLRNANGDGRGNVIGISGPVTLLTEGPTDFGGAHVRILISTVDSPERFVPTGYQFRTNGSIDIVGLGAGFLVADLFGSGPDTDITLILNEP